MPEANLGHLADRFCVDVPNFLSFGPILLSAHFGKPKGNVLKFLLGVQEMKWEERQLCELLIFAPQYWHFMLATILP